MALDFDSGEWIELGSLDFASAGNPWSFSALVFPFDLSGSRTIIGPITGNGGAQFRVNTDGTLSLLKRNIAGVGASTGAIDTTRIWHCGVTWDGADDWVIYIDGAADASGTTATSFDARLYALGNANGEDFVGRLAEAAIWDVVLSADEMKSLYKRFVPKMIRPSALLEHVPMVRSSQSAISGASLTVNGTLSVTAHPRTIWPARPLIGHNSAGAAPSGRVFKLSGRGGGLAGPSIGLAG